MSLSETWVATAIMIGGLIAWLVMHREGRPRYRHKTLLIDCELEFFQRLQKALPHCWIFPQVALSALIEPVGIGRNRQAALALIATRRVGYAVFDDEMRLLTVVELNHRPRLKRSELTRDKYLAAAGIRTLRFNARHLPSEARIHGCVFSRTAPPPLKRGGSHVGRLGADIEFKPPEMPWKNTADAHI
jgi:hypothetical protein